MKTDFLMSGISFPFSQPFKIYRGVVILLTLISLAIGVNRVAASEVNCIKLDTLQWYEVRSKSFTLIYPEEFIDVAPTVFKRASEQLEEQYALLSRIFVEDLDLPIIIRIYPSMDYFSCLNMYESVYEITTGFSRIGQREVSLIISGLEFNYRMKDDQLIRGITAQLSQIFAVRLSDDKAPQGLLEGLAYYLDNNVASSNHNLKSEPQITWRMNWEAPPDMARGPYYFETLSIVSYLIDVYEWPAFVSFMSNLATSASYTEALSTTYKTDFSALQKEWHEYYVLFYQGRWKVNAIYDYDLSFIDQAIRQGAYTDARLKLVEITPFLEDTRQQKVLDAVAGLIQKATRGEQAGLLVKQSRQAIQAGEFQRSLELSDQALSIYQDLQDNRRLDELQQYQQIAEKVQSLRNEMEELEMGLGDQPYYLAQTQLTSLAEQLDNLGDHQGSSRAQEMLAELNQRQSRREKIWLSILLGISLMLLGLRFVLVRNKRLAEVL